MSTSVDVLVADDSADRSATAFGFAVVTFVAFAAFAFFVEPLDELPYLAVLHFAIAEDEGFDLLHEAVLGVRKTDSAVYEIGLFYFAGVILSGLTIILNFNLVKNHIIYYLVIYNQVIFKKSGQRRWWHRGFLAA